MKANSLLVELGVEELPPKSLEQLSKRFAELIIASLQTQGLIEANGHEAVFNVYASPRRLAVWIANVMPDVTVPA